MGAVMSRHRSLDMIEKRLQLVGLGKVFISQKENQHWWKIMRHFKRFLQPNYCCLIPKCDCASHQGRKSTDQSHVFSDRSRSACCILSVLHVCLSCVANESDQEMWCHDYPGQWFLCLLGLSSPSAHSSESHRLNLCSARFYKKPKT